MLSTLLSVIAISLALSYVAGLIGRRFPGVAGKRLQAGAGLLALVGAAIVLARGQPANALGLAAMGLWFLHGAGTGWWPAWPPSASAGDRIATDHLEAVADRTTGRLSGRVLKGFFAGRRLEALRAVELAHLWQDCRLADPASARLLEAHLDGVHPTWREDMARAEADAPRGPDGKMTRAEALEILGLGDQAGDDDVRRAHRDLIQRFHPDRGGSNYLAAKINEAKEVALRRP